MTTLDSDTVEDFLNHLQPIKKQTLSTKKKKEGKTSGKGDIIKEEEEEDEEIRVVVASQVVKIKMNLRIDEENEYL
jgi:hypothetical protein